MRLEHPPSHRWRRSRPLRSVPIVDLVRTQRPEIPLHHTAPARLVTEPPPAAPPRFLPTTVATIAVEPAAKPGSLVLLGGALAGAGGEDDVVAGLRCAVGDGLAGGELVRESVCAFFLVGLAAAAAAKEGNSAAAAAEGRLLARQREPSRWACPKRCRRRRRHFRGLLCYFSL